MSTGEELWIYHDAVSPLSYSSAPHGSCHTLKGQKSRLNTVRLAFLLTKLRGVGARCRWTQMALCVYMSVTESVFLVFSRWCGGQHDTSQDMMSVGSRSVRCDGGVCRCVGSCGMLNVSLHLPSIFSLGFMFKGISPENPLHSTKTTRHVCVYLCERARERETERETEKKTPSVLDGHSSSV